MNILRDAAHLQTQLRQYDGLVETRHTLLRIRPNLRSNWVGLAVAYHLNGNLIEAKKTLEHYETILKVCYILAEIRAAPHALPEHPRLRRRALGSALVSHPHPRRLGRIQ